MSQTDRIRAIITANVGEGPGALLLERAVRSRVGAAASQADVDNAVGFCREIIQAVPMLIDRVREAAAAHGVEAMVEPLLAHAEAYFVADADLLPERLFGELGLIDDAYLALSVIKLVQAEEHPLIAIDLAPPLAFLEKMLGEETLAALQLEKRKAFEALLSSVQALVAENEAAQRRKQAEEARRRQQQAEAARRRAEAVELKRRQDAARQPGSGGRPRPGTTAPAASGPAVQRPQCGSCSGQGTVTCSACGGHGSHVVSSTRIDWEGNTEYLTDYVPCGCSGGRTICGRCGGAGFTTG